MTIYLATTLKLAQCWGFSLKGYTKICYDILSKIYREKAYSTLALYKMLENEPEADLINRIVLGVLERNVELDYIINQLSQKSPQLAVKIILKQGIYCLKYMNSLPDYAVINNNVELTKAIGKQQVSGFVNAVLNKVARGEYLLPNENNIIDFYSIRFSKPTWLVEKLFADFGNDTAINILSATPYELTHIRENSLKTTKKELEDYLIDNNIVYSKSEVGGFLLKISPKIKHLFNKGIITYQSITSMLTVDALDVKNGQKVLDICSAPGGKSVLIAEKNINGLVLACDIYPHRITLVNKYANRMGVKNIKTKVLDATIFQADMVNAFDRVLVDVPCSALGITRKHPDILLNRTLLDIDDLKKVQLKILTNASSYLKKGGVLVYSTCTITKEENIEVINEFLAENRNFKLQKIDLDYKNNGTLQFLPAGAIDGFFIAKLVKENG